MNPSDNDKVRPEPRSYSYATLFAIVIMAAQVLISLVTYPFLPNMVPSHWNAAGQIDSYSPKWVHAILFPAMSIGIYILVRVLLTAGPRLGYQNSRRASQEVVNLILVGVLLLNLVIQLAITAMVLGLPIDIVLVVNLGISLLLIFIGNYMGKLRRNFWAGVRTPWTLVSDVVWERTNRLGGWLFVLAGFLGIIMSFVSFLRIWGLLVMLLLIVVILFVYSYLVYRRLSASGGESLSPPFGGDNVV